MGVAINQIAGLKIEEASEDVEDFKGSQGSLVGRTPYLVTSGTSILLSY